MRKFHLQREGQSRRARAISTAAAIAAAAVSFSHTHKALAAITATWTDGGAGNNWSSVGNWNSAVPGNDTGSITNTDTAIFNSTPGSNVVNLDVSNWDVGTVEFTGGATNFTIGQVADSGNNLELTGGTGTISPTAGDIDVTSSVSAANSITINDPIVLEAAAGASNFVFQNDSSVTGIKFQGQISAGTAVTPSIYLTGASTSTSNQFLAPIVNGAASAINMIKTGAGEWQFESATASTNSGTLTVENGTVNIATITGISPNVNVVVGDNADAPNFDYGVTTSDSQPFYNGNPYPASAFPSIQSLTVIPGGQFTESNSSASINTVTQSGFGLILSGTDSVVSDSSDPKFKGGVGLEGTGPSGTDGLLFINSTTATFSMSDEKTIDLGSVNRTFYSTQSGTTSTDLQLEGVISGTGGIIKTGPGVIKFEDNGTAPNEETFTGPIEIQQGALKLVGSMAGNLQGQNPLLVDGGTFNLNGSSASTGAVVVTSGTITSGNATNDLFAPSFSFTPAPGAAVVVNDSLDDESGATIYSPSTNTVTTATGISAVYVANPGTVTFGGTAMAYTGGTTITNGVTLLANMAASGAPLSTGAITMGGGTLFLNPNNATAAVSYTLASAASATLSYAGGAILGVKNGSNPSETVTIGNSGASSSSLVRSGNGTFVLYVNGTGSGLAANLGPSNPMQVFVNGGVPTTNGIVNPSIVGDNAGNSNGDFLTYGASGFASAASLYTSTFGATSVYDPGAPVALAGPESAYAINNGGSNIDLEGNTLTVGSGSGQAGIILNGAAIQDTPGTGALAFGGAEGVVYSNNASPTLSAKITGTAGLTLFGPGDLTLSGNNSGLSGGLNLNQGIATVTNDDNLGSTSNAITFGGGTLQFGGAFTPSASRSVTISSGGGTIDTESNAIALGSAISGIGALTKVGAGTLSLISSSNNWTGGTTINAGTLSVGNGSTGSIGSGNILNNSALLFNLSGNASVASVISGSGTVSQSGGASSVVNLSGSNTFTGATNIGSGTLQVGSANALGFGGQIVGSNSGNAVVTSGGTLDLNGQSLNKIVVLNGGTLVNSSTSTAASIATGVQSYTVTNGGSGLADDLEAVSGGTGTGANLKLLLGVTSASFNVTTQGTNYSNTPTVVISGGGGTGATATANVSSGAITGFTITNPGVGYWGVPTITVTDSSGSGVAVTANQDDFTAVGAVALLPGSGYTTAPTVGSYTVGGFGIGNPAAIGAIAAPAITANIDQLEVQSNSSITGAGAVQLAGDVTGASSGATPTLTLGGTSALNSITGPISDGNSAGLAINNTGTWTLSGANTYSKGTTLTSGRLIIANGSNGSATGTGNVILNGGILSSPAGATGGTISGTVVVGSGAATVAPGGVGSVGFLTVGGLSTGSNMTLSFDLGSPDGGNASTYTGSLIDISSVGGLTVGTNSPIAFATNPIVDGDYPLLQFTGGITGSEFAQAVANFTLPSQAGFQYALSDTADSGYLDLVVSPAASSNAVFWDNAGAGSPTNGTTWDTTNNNWNNGSAATTYANGDAVTFNDSNAGHYFVTLASTVSPASVTVNSTGNYSITGGGLIISTGGFTKSNTGTLTLGVGLTASSLAINGGNVVIAGSTTAGSGWISNNATHDLSNINITSLSIASGSVLDITNNHLFIDYGSSDPIGTILGYLKTGFNGGAWNGTTGIISSTAQTPTNNLKYGIGWADGADGTHAVAGLTSGEIELKYTLLGDANLDGSVNGTDFSILAANFGLGVTNWDQGNFLYGSSVNGSDFSALAANFGQGDSGAAVTPADVAALDAFAAANGLPAPTIAAVPEPATLGLLALGATGLLARRRRK